MHRISSLLLQHRSCKFPDRRINTQSKIFFWTTVKIGQSPACVVWDVNCLLPPVASRAALHSDFVLAVASAVTGGLPSANRQQANASRQHAIFFICCKRLFLFFGFALNIAVPPWSNLIQYNPIAATTFFLPPIAILSSTR